jgi:hypothetical protein
MSAFGGLITTNIGRNLQAKAQLGTPLQFTRMGLGDGELGGSPIVDLTALKHEVKSLNLAQFQLLTGGKAKIRAVLSNQDVVSGFYWREIGVFAHDPDLGEILYCYGNAGALAEYIPAGGGADVIEKVINIITLIGNASSVSAVLDQSLVWATQQEFEDHITNADAHPQYAKITDLAAGIGGHEQATNPHPQYATGVALATHLAEKMQQGVHGIATTSDVILYVRPDGNDANDGSANDAARALLTIQAAINKVPQIINHNVIINVAAGTYAEDILISGFYGKGNIQLLGANSLADASNYKVNKIHCTFCSNVLVRGFEATITNDHAFKAQAVVYSTFQYCKVTTISATYAGFLVFTGALTLLINCEASNRLYALYCYSGIAYSNEWTIGDGNTIGIKCEAAGTVGKYSTQPQGATAEMVDTGGVIR